MSPLVSAMSIILFRSYYLHCGMYFLPTGQAKQTAILNKSRGTKCIRESSNHRVDDGTLYHVVNHVDYYETFIVY